DRLLEPSRLAIVVLVVAGHRRAMHDVAALSQMPGHRFHFGAGVPRAVNQNVSVCHSRLPSISKNRTLIETAFRFRWPDSATAIGDLRQGDSSKPLAVPPECARRRAAQLAAFT